MSGSPQSGQDVIVVGAGLAGLVVSLRLRQAGFNVSILESSRRAGGKAGAEPDKHGVLRDHGYHIFPAWYLNIRALLAELQIELANYNRWNIVTPGSLSSPYPVHLPTTLRGFIRSLFDGPLPWYEAFLNNYFILDAISAPMTRKAYLDRVSRVGFARSKWYMTEAVAALDGENIMKATAAEGYEISAMTAKLVYAYWMCHPDPFFSLVRGDLDTVLIRPFVAAIEKLGEPIEYGTAAQEIALDGEDLIVVTDSGKRCRSDFVVVAVPFEVAKEILTPDVLGRDLKLGRLESLESAPMAALHLTCDKVVPNLPREPCMFFRGKYGLSFVDLHGLWPDINVTTLSIISSDFRPLLNLDEERQFELLFEEIRRYVPLKRSDVASYDLRTNECNALMLNTVGAWHHRPLPQSAGNQNLYFAGDWVRNPLDLACMEGAVWSGLQTAHLISRGCHRPVPPPVTPEIPSMTATLLTKWALTPAAVMAWGLSRVIRGGRHVAQG